MATAVKDKRSRTSSTIMLDRATMERLRILAAGRPLTQFLREFSYFAGEVNPMLKAKLDACKRLASPSLANLDWSEVSAKLGRGEIVAGSQEHLTLINDKLNSLTRGMPLIPNDIMRRALIANPQLVSYGYYDFFDGDWVANEQRRQAMLDTINPRGRLSKHE